MPIAPVCQNQKHTNYFLYFRVHQEITDDTNKHVKGKIKVGIFDFMGSKFIVKSLFKSKSKLLSNEVPKKAKKDDSDVKSLRVE